MLLYSNATKQLNTGRFISVKLIRSKRQKQKAFLRILSTAQKQRTNKTRIRTTQ